MMNAISFKKGKIAFQLLLIVLFRWSTTTCQLNLYNTDRTIKNNSLPFDCLNYYIYREELAYQELSNVVDEMIPHCFLLENHFDESFEDVVGPFSQNLTFEELRLPSITSLQLLSWPISINVAERYQFYLKELNPSLNEPIYNCTAPWFGVRCQYSFAFGEEMSFKQSVEAAFHGRKAYSEMSNMMVEIPCYVLLECHRNGQFWCLDWREVCDGNIDCFDEGVDEEFCFDMEINEYGETEYRCHNGLCIAHELWEEGKDDPDCLDRSDEVLDAFYINSCFQDPTFRCEEHSCRPFEDTFPCGDGQCVSKFDKCPNGRHVLLIDSMAAKGNLTDECWIAMVCLTKLAKQINGHLCETWLMDNSNYKFLEQCDSFFQFPTIPVYDDHIGFFYKNPHLRPSMSEFFLPDYICYDHQPCDVSTSQLVHGNFTCSLQDHPTCPSTKICLCPNCFFGNQCQFYAKGLGSTLDEILGYEFKRNTILSKQPLTIKVSAAVTMVIFLLGIVNGILWIMTFSRKNSQEVGTGIYLLASSITSLLTMILFTLKFWLIFLSHQSLSNQWFILIANCRVIEPLLKMVLYLDNWFNACVAIERIVSAFQGISFNKTKSKRVAKCVTPLLCVTIICLFIPQLLNLHVFDDKTEERSWCVVTYTPWLQKYSSTLIFVHYFAPLSINIFSAIFIIIVTTRQRVTTHPEDSFCKNLRFKFKQCKHLLISPAIIIFLTLPHLIISIILDCNKSSHLYWSFLIGYFLSFIPATLIFIIFVIPSPVYKKEFTDLIKPIKRRLVYRN